MLNILKILETEIRNKANHAQHELVDMGIGRVKNYIKNKLYTSRVVFDTNNNRCSTFYSPTGYALSKKYLKVFGNEMCAKLNLDSVSPKIAQRFRRYVCGSELRIPLSMLTDDDIINGPILTGGLVDGIYVKRLDRYTLMIVNITDGTNTHWNDEGEFSSYNYMTIVEYIVGINFSKWATRFDNLTYNYIKKYRMQEMTPVPKKTVTIFNSSGIGEESPVQPIHNIINTNIDNIMENITGFIKNEKLYRELNIPYKMGILLSGAPGTGKTSIGKSIAHELGRNVEFVNVSELKADINTTHSNPYRYGTGIRPIQPIGSIGHGAGNVYRYGGDRNAVPRKVIIIDEIDAQLMPDISNTRDEKQVKTKRLLNLISYIDRLNGGEIIVATTNHIENLDPKIIRSGRFDYHYEFENLNREECEQLIRTRGIDDDGIENILEGKSFPYNPATLEQDCISYLIKKNGLNIPEKLDIEDIVGLDSSKSDAVDGDTENTDNTVKRCKKKS